jgi:hypothetical protein
MTFSSRVISFLGDLDFSDPLPEGVRIMNPFRENPAIMPVISEFYTKFYNDNNQRHLILGINPGRFGAGSTGIPFTDTKRLADLGLSLPGINTHEPSSAFVYEMIASYGGPVKFYSDFYISAISPLGFTHPGNNGKQVNYNYYDSRKLTEAVYGFMKEKLEVQLEFGIYRDICFCLGTGKNFSFIDDLNKKFGYFGEVIPLEHPRFIMQYKTKQKDLYISRYLSEFSKIARK